MTKLDELLKRGTTEELRAEYHRMTGLDSKTDPLAGAAFAARNYVIHAQNWVDGLDVWMHSVEKLSEDFPKEPEDELGSLLFNADYLAVLRAYRELFRVIGRVRKAGEFQVCVVPPTTGRKEDTPARAFALALVWLWKHAGRAPPTPGPTALLAVVKGVDTQEELRALGSPTRRWKSHLAWASALVNSGDPTVPGLGTMPIYALLTAYGRSPEAVIATLTDPAYLDGIRRRQTGVGPDGHQVGGP